MQDAQWRHGRVAIWRPSDLGAQVCGSLSVRSHRLDERITCRGWDCRSTSRRGCYSVRQKIHGVQPNSPFSKSNLTRWHPNAATPSTPSILAG